MPSPGTAVSLRAPLTAGGTRLSRRLEVRQLEPVGTVRGATSWADDVTLYISRMSVDIVADERWAPPEASPGTGNAHMSAHMAAASAMRGASPATLALAAAGVAALQRPLTPVRVPTPLRP
jgi:hypothetical protein